MDPGRVDWTVIKKGRILTKGVDFTEVDVDNLSDHQLQAIYAGARLQDLRPISASAEQARLFLVAIRAYLEAKQRMA